MSTERKLATIRRIEAIEPIEGADLIELIHIGGWQCVSAKDNHFKVGDPCVYFEIDSHLPVEPRFEFLRKNCFKVLEGGREGFRIKTIRLRGQLSQGMVLPIELFPEITADILLGADEPDVTELLNIAKYEKPLPAQLSGMARGNFPAFIIKTDADRIQNSSKLFKTIPDEALEASLKLDGSSTTIYNYDGVQSVCSKNLDLKETEGNTFWKVANMYQFPKLIPEGFAIQGELMGPNIQGNREGFKDHDIYLFDAFDITKRQYLLPKERQDFFGELQAKVLSETGLTIKQVPHLGVIWLKDFTMKSLLEFAEGKSINNPVREGIVLRSLNRVKGEMIKVKVISNSFLLKEKD